MKFLIDEDVPVKIIPFLRKLGHNVKRVPSGLKNGTVMRLAIHEKRVLVTRDADFTDVIRYPPSICSGIIHIDVHPPYWEDIAPPLDSLLLEISSGLFSGKLIVLGPDGYKEFPDV